ncbi:MAG: GNAT family N-acetyltransferase [Candidatus Electryonea clarkiae]|nr:GNAT family N-acetyltransferase [Candidatus Electryonea clarkiae]MDP8286634.1 GNAT family N-acetyltransferase [Candidatus Electryonea clarkiae]
MQIIDLTEEHEALYFLCLEDWSDEMKESGNRKEAWYNQIKDKGLRVKLALDDKGEVGGMIQYLPIEYSFVHGQDLYVILCVWVHGYKQGRGDFRRQGMGKALIQAAEQDARDLGAKGIAAWGLGIPVWMKASWFKKFGFKKIDKMGVQVLLWKPFDANAVPPKWIKQEKKPVSNPGKVTVTSFCHGWCPAQNITHERAKRAVECFGEKVDFQDFDTSEETVFEEWGIVDGLFINSKSVRTGPPPSYEKIKKKIKRRVKKLKL